MSTTATKKWRPLSEAKFTERKFERRSGPTPCDCLVIDPCGCYVDPCTCIRRDAEGCYKDCPCDRPPPRPDHHL